MATPTHNNRLLKYEEYQPPRSGPGPEPDIGPEAAAQFPTGLQRVVWYTYFQNGPVANITIGDASEPLTRRDLALYYNNKGTLWVAVQDHWTVSTQDISDYGRDQGWEFRFDSGRARYLRREVDVAYYPNEHVSLTPIGDQQWTDYVGDSPYGDFDVAVGENTVAISEQMRYLSAGGVMAQQNVQSGDTAYHHADLLGSTMLTTDADGAAAAALAYTAFGEPLGDASGLGTRYQYAGGYGYEADQLVLPGATGTAPITLTHVGARWYQPETGRFVQRDPLGLQAGLNTYQYVNSEPVGGVDPSGLWRAYDHDWPDPPWFPAGAGPGLVGGVLAGGKDPKGPIIGLVAQPLWSGYVRCFNRAANTLQLLTDWYVQEMDNNLRDLVLKGPSKSWTGPTGFCFAEGTTIWASGLAAPVESVGPGDQIDSLTADLCESDSAVITVVRIGGAVELTEVSLPGETLRCTALYPFLLHSGRWVRAGKLRAGDELESDTGIPVPILGISTSRLPVAVPVFDLTVEPTHVYVVGRSRVVVHNKQ
jgi:RHS repeat-associated protein